MRTVVSAGDADGKRTESLLERALIDAADGSGQGDRGGQDSHPGVVDILDAAYDLFCRQGVQRTSMDDVARRAGLSRITVYRRVSSKEALVEQVVLREFRRYFDQFLLDISRAETLADRVAVGFVSSLKAIRTHPLIGERLAAEPEVFVPSLLGARGSTLLAVARFLAGQLRREQAAGNVAADVDVDVVAELMVRLCTSFLLAESDLIDLDDDAGLDAVARRYLVPLLEG